MNEPPFGVERRRLVGREGHAVHRHVRSALGLDASLDPGRLVPRIRCLDRIDDGSVGSDARRHAVGRQDLCGVAVDIAEEQVLGTPRQQPHPIAAWPFSRQR